MVLLLFMFFSEVMPSLSCSSFFHNKTDFLTEAKEKLYLIYTVDFYSIVGLLILIRTMSNMLDVPWYSSYRSYVFMVVMYAHLG